MLSDSEKKELAEVVALVIDSRMEELYAQIALGFVEISNGMMEDLALIMNAQTSRHFEEMKKRHEARSREISKRAKVGF